MDGALKLTLIFFSVGVYLTIGSLKPRPNDCNISTQHIERCNMLRAFGHAAATCCDMLGIVGSWDHLAGASKF